MRDWSEAPVCLVFYYRFVHMFYWNCSRTRSLSQRRAIVTELHMEWDFQHPDASIGTSTNQLAPLTIAIQPKHSVYTSRDCILNRYILHRLRHAPYVNMSIEGARRAMLWVRSPWQGVNACGVERPPPCDHLSTQQLLWVSPWIRAEWAIYLPLLNVKQNDLPARLTE